MTDATRFQFTSSSVPGAYDEYLVPRLFAPWAQVLLDATNVRPGDKVLDVATGPGTVARAAALRVGKQGQVIGTDISAPMLAIARSKSPTENGAYIEYIESPAAPLAVRSASFDVVLCQQGLQFFPDRVLALQEMRRALRSGGRLSVAVWGALKDCEVYAAYHRALSDAHLNALAQTMTLPFSWPSRDDIAAATQKAGFSQVRVETRRLPLVYEGGVTQVMAALAGAPIGPALAELTPTVQATLATAAQRAFKSLLDAGSVRGQMVANILTAVNQTQTA
jgi:ubiquinone/menaquinone biosynthesis C-methylase UbiE